jgi:hypothetical protein
MRFPGPWHPNFKEQHQVISPSKWKWASHDNLPAELRSLLIFAIFTKHISFLPLHILMI